MRIRDVLAGGLLVLLGFVAGNLDSLQAQQQIEVVERQPETEWDVYHSSYSDGDDSEFYVIKHNRLTGQTLVLSSGGDVDNDSWYDLPTTVGTGD